MTGTRLLRAGTWLALLALYGQLLSGLAPQLPAMPAWSDLAAATICHADDGGTTQAPAPARQHDRQHCLPCALCAGIAAPSPLLSTPPDLPRPRLVAAVMSAPPAPADATSPRASVPPARGPPLA